MHKRWHFMEGNVRGFDVSLETNIENSKKSFVSVLKRGSQSHVTPEITKPALVLDETCIKEFDFGTSIMGRAKGVSAIPNIPCIIYKEGFQNVKLSYLGGMWVLFEFDSLALKEKFLNHSAWTANTFRKIASLWGEYVEWEEADLKSLSCKHLCLKTNMKVIINERQKVIIHGKVYWIRVKKLDAWFPNFQEDDQDDLSSDGESQEGDVANKADNNKSDVDRVSKSSFMHENNTAHKDNNICISCSDEPKFPPGFTPDNNVQEKNVEENIKDTTERVQSLSNKLNDRCSNRGFSSQRSMNSHSQKSKVGGSVLDIMDELVTVGQTMGYNMAGLRNKAKRRWIKELCQKHRINFASIQETKAESISLHTIKDLWGNQMFDHVVGSSVNCSGGILCMWNPNMFVKEQVSTCDYFVDLMGTWAPTSSKLFIISVYAPQELNERRDLWDYLRTFIDRWEGDTVIIGDFNEVRSEHERKINIQQNLSEVYKLIDQGKSNDEILIKRITLLNDLQELNNRNAIEISQKLKIRLSIEGDENSKNFHVFIGEWNNNNIQSLLSVLRCFYLASGLKINLHKSKLMGIGVSSNVVAAATSLIGCSILTTPFNYLGVKLKLLFIGGRLSLLKSVLISIPLYHMSMFKVSIGVLNHLESIRRNCFYGVDGSDRKLVWIGWNMVLTLKKNGGLGVSSFFLIIVLSFSRALDTNKLIPRRSLWQDVILAIHSLQSKGEFALKVLYKMLYALEMCKSISVAEKTDHPSLSRSFCRMLRGSQEFSVKSPRILIDNTILPKAEVPTRWLRVVPIKVNVHAWMVCLDKLPTRANLSLRGMDILSIAYPLSHGFTILPRLLSYSESTVIGCAIFTAYGAITHAGRVRPGNVVAVIGVGDVGSR
nr:RNA-directed DNA polymerase, eukaryota [Tanacetum cinerariifolium]